MANSARSIFPLDLILDLLFGFFVLMFPLKGAEIADDTLTSRSSTIQTQLAALAQLAFSFEMNGFHGTPNSRPHHTHRSRSRSVSSTQAMNTDTVSERQLSHIEHPVSSSAAWSAGCESARHIGRR